MTKALWAGLAVTAILAYVLVANSRGARSGADAAAIAELEAAIGSVERDIAALSDHDAIVANEHEYDRGLDRHDEALMSKMFWPDAALMYGPRVPVAELPTWANDIHSQSAAHKHHVTTPWLDFDGDQAHAEVGLLFASNVPRDKAFDTFGDPTPGRVVRGAVATLGSGRYINRYERRGGDWRVAVHEYVQDVSVVLEAVDVCARSCIARWDASDISYLRPLRPLSADERLERTEQGMAPRARIVPSD
jgi:hypothetical protein